MIWLSELAILCVPILQCEWKMWSIMEMRCCYRRIRREAADQVVWNGLMMCPDGRHDLFGMVIYAGMLLIGLIEQHCV